MANLGLPDSAEPVELYDRDTDAHVAVDLNGKIGVSSCALPTGAATETTLSTINTKMPSQGQAAMAASVPVVIANNQSAVPENITQIAGAAPSATNPLPGRLTDGTSFYDARQIRALVNTDVVKAQIQDNAGTAVTVGQKTASASLPVVLASDQAGSILSLGDQKLYTSSTPQISTYTASGKHYSYAAINFNLATSGGNNTILLITNPNASGKTYLMEEVVYFGRGTTSRQILFQWISAPTITANGTAVTPFNRNVGGAASAINIFTGPTLTLPSGTTFHETMHYANSIQPLYEKWEQDFILGANRSIALIGIPSGLNVTVTVIVQWVEV
jgi:hypothetical protein